MKLENRHPRFNFVLLVAVGLAVLTIGAVACTGSKGASVECQSTKAHVDKGASVKHVILFVNVADNGESAAESVAKSVAETLGDILEESKQIVVTGLTSGGTEESIVKIDCMDGGEYKLASQGNSYKEDRKKFVSVMTEAVMNAVRATEVAETGDPRVLLEKVPEIAAAENTRVVLWSTFLSQGNDCLEQQAGANPSYQLAAEIATRCADLALLPEFRNADMTILGAGSSAPADNPALASFGVSLAAELCNRMAQSCDIR